MDIYPMNWWGPQWVRNYKHDSNYGVVFLLYVCISDKYVRKHLFKVCCWWLMLYMIRGSICGFFVVLIIYCPENPMLNPSSTWIIRRKSNRKIIYFTAQVGDYAFGILLLFLPKLFGLWNLFCIFKNILRKPNIVINKNLFENLYIFKKDFNSKFLWKRWISYILIIRKYLKHINRLFNIFSH